MPAMLMSSQQQLPLQVPQDSRPDARATHQARSSALCSTAMPAAPQLTVGRMASVLVAAPVAPERQRQVLTALLLHCSP